MKISLLINMKMPTFVGIFIFISRGNSILSWVGHKKSFITSGLGVRIYKVITVGTSLHTNINFTCMCYWRLFNIDRVKEVELKWLNQSTIIYKYSTVMLGLTLLSNRKWTSSNDYLCPKWFEWVANSIVTDRSWTALFLRHTCRIAILMMTSKSKRWLPNCIRNFTSLFREILKQHRSSFRTCLLALCSKRASNFKTGQSNNVYFTFYACL